MTTRVLLVGVLPHVDPRHLTNQPTSPLHKPQQHFLPQLTIITITSERQQSAQTRARRNNESQSVCPYLRTSRAVSSSNKQQATTTRCFPFLFFVLLIMTPRGVLIEVMSGCVSRLLCVSVQVCGELIW